MLRNISYIFSSVLTCTMLIVNIPKASAQIAIPLLSPNIIHLISPSVVILNNLPPLNQAVYNYAQSRLGQQIGDGECATLVSEALKYAGAKDFSELGPTGSDADYVWGILVTTLTPGSTSTNGILVGDIIQFRDVQTYHKTINSNGSWSVSTDNYPHHTAIVSSVSGSQISLLHQNVNGSKTVQVGTLDLNDVTYGKMWVYRPIAK